MNPTPHDHTADPVTGESRTGEPVRTCAFSGKPFVFSTDPEGVVHTYWIGGPTPTGTPEPTLDTYKFTGPDRLWVRNV